MTFPSANDRVILEDLGRDSYNVPYYLKLLNLYFGDEKDREISLKKYESFALELKNSPRKVKKLILDRNWRPVLVGNVVAILLQEETFQRYLIWRLKKWSWVAPQIAVGIALIDRGKGEPELKKIIDSANTNSDPKTIMSAYSALRFLGSGVADDFEQTELFGNLKEQDSLDNSTDIAETHWQFWKGIISNTERTI